MSDRTDGTVPTLAYALLALLARHPLTGYQLSQQMRDPIGLFWHARHSQIYPVLARIEGLGWVTSTASAGPGPRPRRRYSATEAGVAALRAWVEGPSVRRGRDELLLRVYASWVSTPDTAQRFLSVAERHHAAQLAEYLARRAAVVARGGPGPPGSADFADYATLRRGIGFERGRLVWVRWLSRQVETGWADPATGRSADDPRRVVGGRRQGA